MTIQLNPVAVRESRAMWRGARSFLLLLCYAGALSIVAFLSYSSEVRYAASWAADYGGETQVQSARVGHTLFMALSLMQLVAWLLIAPALSATSVSAERERGLLESLLMSNLRPRQIIAGKFSVSASFVAILIVATLPVLAICFLLGGVSPAEFGGALALQLATAFCALSLGVWCSTALKLSTHALGATFAALVGWMLLTLFLLWVGDNHGNSPHWLDEAARFLALHNPFIGLMTLLENNSGTSDWAPFGIPTAWMWVISVASQVLAGTLFLRLAARALSRPLDAEDEAPRSSRKNRKGTANHLGAERVGEPVALLEGEEPDTRAWAREEREESGHFEVPLLSRIVAGGPLLRHHLRASWRWKKPRGKALKWWQFGGVMFVLANVLAVIHIAHSPRDAEGMFITLLGAAAIVIPVFVTASSGLSIARDRELGTWNHLRLSSIRSAEIARAKMLTPLIAGLGYALVAIAPLALLAWHIARGEDHWNNSDVAWSPEARLFCGLALALPFWLLGCLQLSGWALICSTRAKRSSIALVAAFAGGLIFIVGLPVVFSLSYSGLGYEAREEMIRWLGPFHPLAAMGIVGDVMQQLNYLHNTQEYGYGLSESYTGVPWLAYLATLLSHCAITYAFYRAVTRSIARLEK